MKLLGLTGNIACGKSTVAALLQEQGAVLIDADLLVRELYATPNFVEQVVALFRDRFAANSPVSVLSLTHADGSINRQALGELVFADPSALRQLEALVHPAVAALREEKLAALRALPEPPPAAVLEAVKLIESGQAQNCDTVWCVVCAPDVQLERLMTRRGLDEAAAKARLANQPDAAAKQALLGSVPLVLIPNNGTLDELRERVLSQWQIVQGNPASRTGSN
jgi:dephospho-CoA kinase